MKRERLIITKRDAEKKQRSVEFYTDYTSRISQIPKKMV